MERRAKKLPYRTPGDVWLFLRSIPLVIAGSLLQKFVPMTKWGHLIGAVHAVPQEIRSHAGPDHLSEDAARLAKAIARSGTVLPWTPSCLAQAYAGQRILRSQGKHSAVVVGLRPEGSAQWPAHAWLISGGEIITGGAISGQYFPASVHSFGSPLAALTPQSSST